MYPVEQIQLGLNLYKAAYFGARNNRIDNIWPGKLA